jgi:hypothetical protein
MIPGFPHKAPDGMHYSYEQFKRNIIAIWLHYECKFDYNNGKPVKCIWGFYDVKKDTYYSPVNSITVGKSVDIGNTRPHTAMPINQTILEACFV